MRRLGAFKSAAAGLLIFALFCSVAVAQRDPVLPDAPLTKDMLDAGIPLRPNLHRVTNNLYRGALARDRNRLLNAVKYYRILHQGWTKQQALAELRDPKVGFHNWRNILDFINRVNVEALRRDVEAAA
jgi:hypothetical protein